MSNLRSKISRLTNRKVPVLALVVVAMLGMVAGVLAATIVVTPVSNTGELGTLHTNSGTMTVTDNGLGVVSNGAAAIPSATFPASGNNNDVNNVLIAGHWFDQITFTDTLTGNNAHTTTGTVRHGTGPSGALLVTATFTLTVPNASSNGTIAAYVDTGVTSLTSPVTVYVSIT